MTKAMSYLILNEALFDIFNPFLAFLGLTSNLGNDLIDSGSSSIQVLKYYKRYQLRLDLDQFDDK